MSPLPRLMCDAWGVSLQLRPLRWCHLKWTMGKGAEQLSQHSSISPPTDQVKAKSTQRNWSHLKERFTQKSKFSHYLPTYMLKVWASGGGAPFSFYIVKQWIEIERETEPDCTTSAAVYMPHRESHFKISFCLALNEKNKVAQLKTDESEGGTPPLITHRSIN